MRPGVLVLAGMLTIVCGECGSGGDSNVVIASLTSGRRGWLMMFVASFESYTSECAVRLMVGYQGAMALVRTAVAAGPGLSVL